MSPLKVKTPSVLAALLALLVTVGVAQGGHELPVYPSYYPHEVSIETMASERAADLLRDATLHAYLGSGPRFPNGVPASIRAVESLGSFVIVRVSSAHDERSACAIVETIVRDMADKAGFVFHPYPVTPLHGDYLYHADRAEAAKARLLGTPTASPPRYLMVKASGALADLVHPEWLATVSEWDAAVEEVDAAELVSASTTSLNGWLGPPWVKSGWFHAERMLADATDDAEANHRTEAISLRLEAGDYRDTVERVNLERKLVATLTDGCRKRVAGYTVKRQYFSAEFANGIENIGFDSIEGLNSPIFIRTVKLKDFPWNGWLKLGIDGRPGAAWNPIGGFGDRFGRLLWSTIGDPALFFAPNDSGWMLNRIADVQSKSGR